MTLFSEVFARRLRLIAPRTTDLVHERDLPAPMDDGVRLLADRWVARDTAASAQPTVLVRSPYGRRQFPGLLFGRLLAERGFQVVIQSVRGTFGSGGEFAPFDERADGAATLRWLRAQRWHAGGVATMGPSYLGLVQWALAADADAREALAGMAIQVSASQFHDQSYPGGSVALETIASWLVLIAAQERRLAPLAINRGLRAIPALMGEHPLIGLDEHATGAPVAWLRQGFEHPGRNGDYWARRDFSVTVPEVSAPVSFVGGWYDILLPWMLDDFRALQESPAPAHPPRLLIGPWAHTSPGLVAAGHREGIAFLRTQLLGDDRLIDSSAATVRLRITGEGGGWREFASWPPAEASPRRWFLAPAGGLSQTVIADADGGRTPTGMTRPTRRRHSAARCCCHATRCSTTRRSRTARTCSRSPPSRCRGPCSRSVAPPSRCGCAARCRTSTCSPACARSTPRGSHATCATRCARSAPRATPRRRTGAFA